MNTDDDSVGLLPALTCVLWVGCVVVGVTGLIGPPMQAASPATQPAATVEPLDVSLISSPPDTAMLAPSIDAVTPPTLDTPPAIDPPPAPPVAAASSSIAFAVPIDAPVSTRARARPAPPAQNTPPPTAVRQLTFGFGEGRQPAPDYPTDAALAGQQGSVGVLFAVDSAGRVTGVSIEHPSPWPSLNESAAAAIRDTWRFNPAAARTCRVTIQFRLTNQTGAQ